MLFRPTEDYLSFEESVYALVLFKELIIVLVLVDLNLIELLLTTCAYFYLEILDVVMLI